MRKDEFVNLIESHVAEVVGDKKEITKYQKKRAYDNVGKQLLENIKAGNVEPSNLSIRTIMEACLQEAGYNQIPWGENKSDNEELREAISASAFPSITKYIIYSEIMPAYEARKEDLSPLFREGTSSRSDVERVAGFTAAEGVEYVAENHPYQRTDFHEKYAEVHLHKYGKIIDLSKEAIYNDNTGQLIERASRIGDKWSEQFEQYLIQTIEMLSRSGLDGWESSSTLKCATFDGTVVTNAIFYSTDHSAYDYMGSQTNSNKTTSVLDTAGLDAAYLLFADMVDNRGDKINIRPKTLLIHPKKASIAFQLLGSPGQYDTGNNAINPWAKGGLLNLGKPIVSPYINVNTDWYLGDFKKQILVLFWEKPNVTTQGRNSEAAFNSDTVAAWKFAVGMGAANTEYRAVVYSDAAS